MKKLLYRYAENALSYNQFITECVFIFLALAT